MAVARSMLEGMGLSEAQISAIIEGHIETVNGLQADRDKYKADAEKLPGVQKELDDLKKAGGDWKSKYDAEKKAHDDFRAEVTRKETRAAKEQAFRQLLKDAKISDKRIETVVKASAAQIEGMELDKDGKPVKAEEMAANIKTEWADFIVTTSTSGAAVDHPPVNTGGTAKTKAEILQIKDATERQAEWAKYLEQKGK